MIDSACLRVIRIVNNLYNKQKAVEGILDIPTQGSEVI